MKTLDNAEYTGSIEVLESSHSFNQKSEINESDWQDELQPDRPFFETLDAIHKDGRLDLAKETYSQMIQGKGLKVTATKESIADLVNDWLEDIGFDEQLEDGLSSYLGTGNWIMEHSPMFDEYVEVPIITVKAITRDKKGDIKRYVQEINNKTILLKPNTIVHLKLTNVGREPFARGLFHSILNDYVDPDTGTVYKSPLIQMKGIESDMGEIFRGHADPTTMFYFEDAGEQFIKEQADKLKKMKKGSKIVTDKKFEIQIIEASDKGKFDSYIEHLQRDLLEPGSKFPLQFFNAGFTARAASESTDSVLIRKVRRIQKRLATQIKRLMIMPYLKAKGKNVKNKDIQVFFETPIKQDATVQDVITSYRDNIIRRPEARKWFIENTTLASFIDQDEMEDEPPITSVTPTNDMGDADDMKDLRDEPEEESRKQISQLQEKILIRADLDASDKRKNTQEILEFIRKISL